MLKKATAALKDFRDDKSGSDAVEMVATTAMMVTFILIGLMVLTYVVQLNNVNFATKRVAREIEVTGIANQSQMSSMFNSILGNDSSIQNKKISISGANYLSGNKIQLKGTFRVTGACDYVIQLINPGNFTGFQIRMPITSIVGGMSEVYFRT